MVNLLVKWFMKIFKKIDKGLSKLMVILIKLYQYTLSPDKWLPSLWLKGRVCMHEPHCSQYGINVFKRYWFLKWLWRSMDRVAQCTWWIHKVYDPAHYRVVFFSSAPIWVPFLEQLFADDRFEVVGVVTQCDKPAGRGMSVCENIVKTATKQCLIWNQEDCSDFVITPNKINPEKSEEWKEFKAWLEKKEADFLVVIAYGKIIPQAILDLPKIAPINVHWSLLPNYRGASPLQTIFLNWDKETWITIMKMDAWMDTGNIIDISKFEIPFDWTVKNVIVKLQDIWPKYLVDTLWKYWKKLLGEVRQDDSKATLCAKIEKEDWLIDPWKDSLENIYKKYRAYYLWPKIYFMFNWIRVIVEELRLHESIFEEQKNNPLIIDKKELNVDVEHLMVKPEGKKAMVWSEFVNGYFK